MNVLIVIMILAGIGWTLLPQDAQRISEVNSENTTGDGVIWQ
jgi:hypothetical protein